MGSYSIGQKHFNGGESNAFATLITDGEQGYTSGIDIGVEGASEFQFDDVYVRLTSENFEADRPYYFHGKIKRLTSEQVFYIRLKNIVGTEVGETEQYIKTIQVKKTAEDENEWVDVEFIFYPYATFNSIVFEMKRTKDDLIGGTGGRVAVIGFEEISLINNYTLDPNSNSFVKIGIQSRPGLMTCINGEEIRLPRSGIQEIRDGIIAIDFFSVVVAAKENGTDLEDQMNTDPTDCRVFLNTSKKRIVDKFTVDYIYEITGG